MKIFTARNLTYAMVGFFIAIVSALVLFDYYFGHTHARVVNNSDANVCLKAYDVDVVKVSAGENKVIKIKLTGDGMVSLKTCSGSSTDEPGFYITNNMPRCAWFEVQPNTSIRYGSDKPSKCYIGNVDLNYASGDG